MNMIQIPGTNKYVSEEKIRYIEKISTVDGMYKLIVTVDDGSQYSIAQSRNEDEIDFVIDLNFSTISI